MSLCMVDTVLQYRLHSSLAYKGELGCRDLFIWVGIWAHFRVVSVLGKYASAFAF
jgi:hypothetical protein